MSLIDVKKNRNCEVKQVTSWNSAYSTAHNSVRYSI